MQHKKNFIQSICRQVAHCPAEQIILCRQENLCHLCQRQLIFVIQAQHLKEVWPCYSRLQTVQAVDAGIQCCTAGIAIKKNLVALRIGQRLSEQRLGVDLAELYEVLKIDIDFLLLRNGLLLYAQVVPDKGAHIILCADLDLVPVFLVIFLLLLGRQSHQDKVPDLVAFTEVKTG